MMNRKTLISVSLAAGLVLGMAAYPAVKQIEQQQALTAAAASSTTADGWKFTYDDAHCEITGCTAAVQGDVRIPATIAVEGKDLPVTAVMSNFFYSGSDITGLTIPASVTILPNQFCELKKNLKTVTFEGELVTLPNSAFLSCTSLTTVKLPKGLMTIGSAAFRNCTRLESIQLPDTVSTLGAYAFADSESLKSITIPGSVTAIPDSAFSGCAALASVTIGDGVKSVGGSAFAKCTSLTEITFPKSVNKVSSGQIFSGCTNLESVTFENPDCEIGNIFGTADKPLTIYGYENSTAQAYCAGRDKNLGEKSYVIFKSIGEKPAPQPVQDTGLFCDANGDETVDVTDAQLVLNYYVKSMAGKNPSWYEMTKNPKAPDAP